MSVAIHKSRVPQRHRCPTPNDDEQFFVGLGEIVEVNTGEKYEGEYEVTPRVYE